MAVTYWTPKLGDVVWLNYPDADEPEGKVVGFVPEGQDRAGQPIIERLTDDAGGPFGRPGPHKGDHVVMHPSFLLPFRFGGPEWKQAEASGRIA